MLTRLHQRAALGEALRKGSTPCGITIRLARGAEVHSLGGFDRLLMSTAVIGGCAVEHKSQLIALLYGQLAGAASLREMGRLASQKVRLYHLGARRRGARPWLTPTRSALRCSADCSTLLAQATGAAPSLGEAVRLVDATSVSLPRTSQSWAGFQPARLRRQAARRLDPDAALPVHFVVTPRGSTTSRRPRPCRSRRARPTSSTSATTTSPGGPSSTRRLPHRHAPQEPTPRSTLIEERRVSRRPPSSPTASATCRPARRSRANPFDGPVREVRVRTETGKVLRILSNDLDASAQEIADLYKRRWQIELFFRWIKQTLRIRHFLGTSENAVRIQIAVALIAYLLIRLAQAVAKTVKSILTFARLIRVNLMHRGPIDQLAAPPTPPPRMPGPAQSAPPMNRTPVAPHR